jgi:PAS domain S-box-containing protein
MNANTSWKGAASDRAAALFEESQDNLHRRADRLFANLMVLQWLAGIIAAMWISPKTWVGATSQTHWHVWAAIFLGGAISGFPIFMIWKQPGRVLTRHVVAVAQTLTSALLIHLTGGRIETHFHVFGSLAFLAVYRDWRVLVTATIVVAADHFARGMFWPQSVFGVLTSSPWRWIEHAGWVVFEDTVLFISIRQSLREMFQVAAHRAKLESVNAEIEHQVAERTAELTLAHKELQASEQRFRKLSASAPIGIFEADAAGANLYSNPQWEKITGLPPADTAGRGWERVIHPEDAAEVFAGWRAAAAQGLEFNREFRLLTTCGEVRWVHSRSSPVRSAAGGLVGHVGTVEDITERKLAEAELKEAHRELMRTSRQAGMAEVATGVLHNVGNVLNSVNVSATLIADQVRKSKSGSLGKLAALLHEHAADLGAFLTADPKGKQLPGYVGQLSDHLAGEQETLLQEVESLRKNVEHIKEIVAMQQNYAKVSGVAEIVKVSELVEDALRMNDGAMMRHEVQVVRDFQPTPPITVDRHKAFQILINLLRNAKYACDDSGRLDKQITIAVANGDGRIQVVVSDNGIGIPTENLTRIFAHGFTTRKGGHGFGLHSGALAAKEMGGSLIAHSDGPGKGAMFTLELPLQPTGKFDA